MNIVAGMEFYDKTDNATKQVVEVRVATNGKGGSTNILLHSYRFGQEDHSLILFDEWVRLGRLELVTD